MKAAHFWATYSNPVSVECLARAKQLRERNIASNAPSLASELLTVLRHIRAPYGLSLSEHAEFRRRVAVASAWTALRLTREKGWSASSMRPLIREFLAVARFTRRAAAHARKEGR